jgi:signal transduction histidine kinase
MDERRLTFLGVATWLIVGIPSILIEVNRGTMFTPRALGWLACYVLWVILFWFATCPPYSLRVRIPLLMVQSLAAFICLILGPTAFMPVLLVIVASQLGAAVPLPLASVWIVVQTVVLGWAYGREGSSVIAASLVYLAFQMFAFLSLRIAHSESAARQELAETHAELQVANGLLELNSRNEERLRIARDLHDLLGHHLTALSLNLEVASHLADGAAREQIEKSKAITKLLLSDVRDVVSSLRHDEPVDLGVALRQMQAAIAKPAIELDIAQEVTVTDPAVAQVALRTIQELVTNAVRHSSARTLRMHLSLENAQLIIEANDDGVGSDRVQYGNGLNGIRERAEQLGGSVEVTSMRGHGFGVKIRLPRERAE